MRILFVHQNFPGQFVHLAKHLALDSSNELVAITDSKNKQQEFIRTIRYTAPQSLDKVGLTRRFVQHVGRAEVLATTAENLRSGGFYPDLILGHFGWGETLFLKDIWPNAKLIVYAEFFYGGDDSDAGFDPEFPGDTRSVRFENRVRNASLALSMLAADRAIAPTQWQRSRFPIELQSKIEVIHDGIDTVKAAPDPSAEVTLKRDGVVLKVGDEVVTFVSRNLEPYRGYHIFMRALPRILQERPKARALIIGGDGVSYGSPAPRGRKWRNLFLEEVKDKLDLSRVHFVGQVPHALFLKAMQISAAHVYLTYPFVLSWSLLEAMACGGLIIGSDTPPVREVIHNGTNGYLTDFFNASLLAERVTHALSSPERHRSLRVSARHMVAQKYDLHRVCLPSHVQILEDLARH